MLTLHAPARSGPGRPPANTNPTSEYEEGYMQGFRDRELLITQEEPLLCIGEVAYDAPRDQVLLRGRPFHLMPQQRKLLAALLTGRLLTNAAAASLLYPLGEPENCVDPTRVVKVHICNIRKKLIAVGVSPTFISTQWGVGYLIHRQQAFE